MGPTTSTGRVLPGLLAVMVASVVLGILGMHAMSTHPVTNQASHGGHAYLSGDTPDPVSGTVLGLGADPVAADVGDGSDERGMGGMGGMVMLCVAMLAATVSALLLLALGVRRSPRFWALLPAAARTIRWVTFRLGTGPPPVWEFSVIRC